MATNEREIWKLTSVFDKHEQQGLCVEMRPVVPSNVTSFTTYPSSFISPHTVHNKTLFTLYGHVTTGVKAKFLCCRLSQFCTAVIFTQI